MINVLSYTWIILDSGDVYAWGYGKACGSKTEDVLVPTKQKTHKQNVIAVAGGNTHSIALTGMELFQCDKAQELRYQLFIQNLQNPYLVLSTIIM